MLERVNFVVKVRCINCRETKMGRVKSQDDFGAKAGVLIKREVYPTRFVFLQCIDQIATRLDYKDQ